eukprot:1481258-Prymnesium_polylepis.1
MKFIQRPGTRKEHAWTNFSRPRDERLRRSPAGDERPAGRRRDERLLGVREALGHHADILRAGDQGQPGRGAVVPQ